jgi:hypothetical protein
MALPALATGSPRVRALVVAAIVGACVGAVEAQEQAAKPIPRVRATDPTLAALITSGIARSKTFAGLAATVDRTDGLVYIEAGHCGHSVHACLVLSVTVAGPYRILHIKIDPIGPKTDIICSIGHELQHAVEVLRERSIRSTSDIFNFFQQEGPTGSERFETPAAVHAGLDVCRDLASKK